MEQTIKLTLFALDSRIGRTGLGDLMNRAYVSNIKIGWRIATILLLFSFHVSFSQRKSSPDSTSSELIQIKKVFILGNEKTKRYIITRELKFEEGEYVPRDDLDEILELSQNNVYNTNLFHTVEIQKLQLDSAQTDILIKVEERWYVWPSPVFRLADRSFNDWWYNRGHDLSRVNYGLKLDVYNFRGQKENLRFIGLAGFEKRLIFQYAIPYIDKNQVHGLTFGGGFLSNKKLQYGTFDHLTYFTDTATAESTNREVTTGYIIYTYRPSFYDYHDFMVQFFDRKISDTIVKYNPNYYQDGANTQKMILLSYTYRRDKRNNKNYPLTGYRTLAMLEKEGIGIFGDVDNWRLTASHYQYFDLGKKFYANTSLGFQLSTFNDVAYFNYTQFGLQNYFVRGFELTVIEGPLNLLTKNSLKYQLFKTQVDLGNYMPLTKFKKVPFAFYPKIILDAGYVQNYPYYEDRSQNTRLTNSLLYSFGLGIDVVMIYDLTFSYEMTYNSEGQLNFFPNFTMEF